MYRSLLPALLSLSLLSLAASGPPRPRPTALAVQMFTAYAIQTTKETLSSADASLVVITNGGELVGGETVQVQNGTEDCSNTASLAMVPAMRATKTKSEETRMGNVGSGATGGNPVLP